MFRRAALPFAKGEPPPAFFRAADAARAPPRAPRAGATGHETMALPVIDVSAPKAPSAAALVTPGPASGGSSFIVEQYAAYCAELAVFPDRAAEIHAKYGIADAGARTALDDTFAQRSHADPRLQQRWRALVAHHGDWYRRQARG
jgi:hypothetical protein